MSTTYTAASTSQPSDAAEPLNYGSTTGAPVHDFDAHMLLRARQTSRRNFEHLTAILSGPELRDLDEFNETIRVARQDVETPEGMPIRDPLSAAMQIWLGIVSSEGLRYMEIVPLDDAVRVERATTSSADTWWNRFDKAEREGFSHWPDKYRKAVIEFAPYLQIARIIYRRCEALVKKETFPEPFRVALEESVGKMGDPDKVSVDYGEQLLIKAGLLESKTGTRTQVKPTKQQAAAEVKAEQS